MSGEPDPLYVRARAALLDALNALEPQLDAVVLVGAQAIYMHTGDADLAAARLFQPGDHAQDRRLAAARWAHQHDEFLVRDVEVDAAYGFDRAEPLGQPFQRQLRHVADRN